jgi:hypothetical protein
MGTIGSPETSVLNQPMLCNIPEDYRIQLKRNESLPCSTSTLCWTLSVDFYWAIALNILFCIGNIAVRITHVKFEL